MVVGIGQKKLAPHLVANVNEVKPVGLAVWTYQLKVCIVNGLTPEYGIVYTL